MERLSGKLLVDTYSKRSQTLVEKVPTPPFLCTQLQFLHECLQAKELEKLTDAYVVVYTARFYNHSFIYNSSLA